MKIFKQPQFKVCTCEICGTVFQPEASDDLYYRFQPAEFEHCEVFARCPTCDGYCEVSIAEEKE